MRGINLPNYMHCIPGNKQQRHMHDYISGSTMYTWLLTTNKCKYIMDISLIMHMYIHIHIYIYKVTTSYMQ